MMLITPAMGVRAVLRGRAVRQHFDVVNGVDGDQVEVRTGATTEVVSA